MSFPAQRKIVISTDEMLDLWNTIQKMLPLYTNDFYGCYSKEDLQERLLHHILAGFIRKKELFKFIDKVDADFGKRVMNAWTKLQVVGKISLPPQAISPPSMMPVDSVTFSGSEEIINLLENSSITVTCGNRVFTHNP